MKSLIVITLFVFSYGSLLAMSQKPATVTSKKIKASHDHKMKATGKSLGYFQILVEKHDNGNGDVKFVAQILPRNDMEGEFKWKLPETVKVLSGEISGDERCHL